MCNVENITTIIDVEYLKAFAKCGYASLVSLYLRKHCANLNHAGKASIKALIPK